MGVFKKQGVYWIDYYVNGRQTGTYQIRQAVSRNVLASKVEIAEGKFLDRQQPITTTFEELADAYASMRGAIRILGT